jgi:Putative transposase, YhgA-like
MSNQPTPHDSVFRRIFGVPENAASQLRAVLPVSLAARLDLGRLARVPASFVDEALKWRYSDLLFTAPLDGRDAFVYLLVEHQSSADALMAFRMLRYVTRIWDHYLRDHPRARRLPVVIPLVVHHGRTRWTSPVRLLDVIDADPDAKKEMEAYLPRFEFLLDDLADVDGEQLRDRELTPSALVTLLLLKTAPGNPQVPAELRPWAAQLRAVLDQPGGTEAFIAILTYIELVSEAPASELRDLAASLGPDAEVGLAVQRGSAPYRRGPFPDGLPPNPACTFQCTGLSSDLYRVRDGVCVNPFMAVGTDDKCLAPLFRHLRGPRGLTRSRLSEGFEAGDLVDCHRGAGLA